MNTENLTPEEIKVISAIIKELTKPYYPHKYQNTKMPSRGHRLLINKGINLVKRRAQKKGLLFKEENE